MSIGIIRAGPWASSSNSFLPQPDPLNITVLPVNCANHYADFWPWICLSVYDDPFIGVEGVEMVPAINGTVSIQKDMPSSYAPFWTLSWRYQAMNQHTLTVSYHAAFSEGAYEMGARFIADGTTVFTDVQYNVLSMSGTESITMPPATIPKRVDLILYALHENPTNTGTFQFSFDLAPHP